ncbi:MAG: M48 family metallopeptidase [Cellulosilyticaceae bacterium]
MYKLIRQNRKTLTLTIDDQLNIIIKAPYHLSVKQIDEFFVKNQEWIQETQIKKRSITEEKDWLKKGTITYLGEKREICIIYIEKGKNKLEYKEEIFNFYVYKNIPKENYNKLLEEYIKIQGYSLFEQLSNRYCKLIDVKYNKITLRKQKTRWGSCSSSGNLSYNIKLMCAPIECIEYVVLHEIMHLKHFNHSEAFWLDIEKIMPDYKYRKEYLKKQGAYFEI